MYLYVKLKPGQELPSDPIARWVWESDGWQVFRMFDPDRDVLEGLANRWRADGYEVNTGTALRLANTDPGWDPSWY